MRYNQLGPPRVADTKTERDKEDGCGYRPETPFADGVRFRVRVHHAKGDDVVWVEPGKSRVVGVYPFAEGTDGYVQVYAEGSLGEVVADAV